MRRARRSSGCIRGRKSGNALLEMLKEQAESLSKDDRRSDQRIERLLEVVAIYRDRLKLDAMVINTLHGDLGAQAGASGALDAPEEHEAMARWNDRSACCSARRICWRSRRVAGGTGAAAQASGAAVDRQVFGTTTRRSSRWKTCTRSIPTMQRR